VEKLFETGKKASRRPLGGGKKPSRKRLGWALRFLRFLFNLALILLVVALMVVSGLYLFVMYRYDDHLDSRYPDLVQNSSVYDADGNRISEFKAEENRRTVGEDELGEYLPQRSSPWRTGVSTSTTARTSPASGARPGRICRRSPSARVVRR
jgi:hypothetical protein